MRAFPEGRAAQVIDFPNVMSKFLMLGMTLDHVIACATVNASRVFPVFHNRGTLKVGAPADVAVLRVAKGNFGFVDVYGARMKGTQKLECELTLREGASDLATRLASEIRGKYGAG